MKKNQFIKAKIENLGYNGEGVFHADGTTVFVPFCIPGETVNVKILKAKNSIAYGKIESVLQTSSSRVEPKCPVFKKCGGCQLQHLSYTAQLEFKKSLVENCLKKIGHVEFNVDSCVPSPNEYEYRNKLQLPIRSEKGVNKIGFFRENSHQIIEISKCNLHPVWAEQIIEIIKNYIEENKVSCYNEEAHSGLIKHLVVREVLGELLIVLVVNGTKIPFVNRLIEGLSIKFDKFSLILNENLKNTNVIFGDKFTTLYGSGKINLTEFGITYSIGAQSFMQVNQNQKVNLYNKVLQLCEINENTVVIDGYSGAGVLTAMVSKKAKKAVGVEIIKEAVESANLLAKQNGLSEKMENVCGDCGEILPGVIEKYKAENNQVVLILDPPRKGVDEKIINQILKSLPDRIIYVSCSPQSLARDLGLILGNLVFNGKQIINGIGNNLYQIESITPFDMFPQCKHVESVVCLTRK